MLSSRQDYVVINIPEKEESYEITISNIKFTSLHMIPKIIRTLSKLTGQLFFDIHVKDLKNE